MSTAPEVRPIRLWYQSYADETIGHPYLEFLRIYLERIRSPNTVVTIHCMTPPDNYAHPIVELRCAQLAVKNAIRAQQEGYDAIAYGHLQDSGLWEARAAVSIPVLGLGEVSMLHACSLAVRSGIVTINPRFIPGFRQQIARYGLQKRVPHVFSVNHQPGELLRSFDSDAHAARVIAEFRAQAERLVKEEVELVIPGGGIPMLLFAKHGIGDVSGAPLLNGIDVLLKSAEMAVSLHRLTGLGASRVADFKLPPSEIVQEFMDQ